LMPNGSPLGIFFAESRKHAGVRAETCGLRLPTIRPALDHFLLSLRQ